MGSGLPWARQLGWFDRGTFPSVPRVRSQFARLVWLRTHPPNGGGAPASSPSSARRSCGVRRRPWARCTSRLRRGPWKTQAAGHSLRPRPAGPGPRNARAQGAPAQDPSLSEAVGSEDRPQAGQEEMRGLQRKKRRSPPESGTPSRRAFDLDETRCSGVGVGNGAGLRRMSENPQSRCVTQPDFWGLQPRPLPESR